MSRLAGHLTAVILIATLTACATSPETGSATDDPTQPDAIDEPGPPLRVGIAEIAVFDVIQENVEAFESSLIELMGEREIEFVRKNAQGEIGNVDLIARQLVDEDLDLIYVVGTPLVVALNERAGETPLVFGIMTDPVGAGIVASADAPGGNATGTSDAIPAERYLDVGEGLVGELQTVGFIGNISEQNTASSLEDFRQEADARGIEVRVAPVASTSDIIPALRSLSGRVDAVFFTADNTVVSAVETVAQAALEEGLPLIGATQDTAEAGGLAGLGLDWRAAGVVAAEMAAEILSGADPGGIPVWFAGEQEGLEIVVNRKTAQELGIEIREDPGFEFTESD